MPITHSRILTLAEEARRVEHTLTSLRAQIRATIGFIMSGDMTGTYEIAGALEAALLANPVPRMDATLTEEQHFAKNARRNERAARRSAMQRRAAGILPDPAKAPASIFRAPTTQPAPAAHREAPAAHQPWTPPADFVYPYAADIERAIHEMDQPAPGNGHQPAPAASAPAAHHLQPETATPEDAEEWITSIAQAPPSNGSPLGNGSPVGRGGE